MLTLRYVTAVSGLDRLFTKEVQCGSISKHSFVPTANTDSTVHTFHDLGHNTSTYILSDKSYCCSGDGRQRSDRRQSASTRGRLLLAVSNGAADLLLLASH